MDQEKLTGRQNFVARNITCFDTRNLTYYYKAIYGKLLKVITRLLQDISLSSNMKTKPVQAYIA